MTVFAIVAVGWVIAEAIPFFSNLVALISSLFNSGFALYLPALMYFLVLREGPWTSRENLLKGFVNGLMLVCGFVVLIGGTWASIQSIVSSPFLLVQIVRSLQSRCANREFGCRLMTTARVPLGARSRAHREST